MIEKIIKKIAQQLDKDGIPYMIIGGQAVLLYGSPRLTRDIDITLGIDTDRFSSMMSICKRAGLKALTKDPEAFAKDTKVFPVEEEDSKIRVDFIFSFTAYEKQAIGKAKKVPMAGYPVKFASCEDVIIHKMFAGRAIDEEDVKNMLIKNKGKLNFKYIKKWLSKFEDISDQKGLLRRLDSLGIQEEA